MIGVIAKHRAAVGNIEHADTVPADLLAALPQGVGRRARPRRGPRLPERAGDRARADRDDQLHDGLRHDRRRAGLLARQVEEARRRRRDHDREQDRADGARASSATRRREVEEIVAFIDERNSDRRRTEGEDRALPGLRLRGRRARHPLPRPREDDGRRPAIHLRRDLEDGEHAGGGHGRGRDGPLRRRVEARRQGDRDLPRQLQGRAAALELRQGRPDGGGDAADPGARAEAPAARPHRSRPQVPGRRPRGLHPRRPLRRRQPRRHLRRHRQGRHHDGRPDELALPRGLDGPPVRRAARGVRLEAQPHALRAERHHERRRHPRRRSRSSTTSSAGSASGSSRPSSRRRRGSCRPR